MDILNIARMNLFGLLLLVICISTFGKLLVMEFHFGQIVITFGYIVCPNSYTCTCKL